MPDTPNAGQSGERLAKVIARSGLCSRRDAEEWIKGGRVAVNGNVIRTPAFNVTEKDKIAVDGKQIAARSGTRVWLYHKPPGLVVTEKDPEGRATIFEALEQAGLPRVLTVGRLDLNTEGLLLLTNDGGLKRVLELPATGWLRRYRVRAFGSITQAQLDGIKDGIEVEGVKYGPIEALLEREQGSNVWLVVSLREGKNREVKNVLGALGLEVNRLIRVSYGPFQLGDLPVGAVEVVKARVLKEQLGKKLATEAGVDFDSDMPEVAAMKREPGNAPDRPGRTGPPRRPPREEKPAGRPRRILFDDGRPPEEFVPPEPRAPKREGERPSARPARAAGAPRREARPDRPDRAPRRDDRPDRPPRREGAPDRPPRAGRPERKSFGDRPPRTGDRPPRTGDRPPRSDRPARSTDRPARTGDRPDRATRAPRREGGPNRPRADRPERKSFGDRPPRTGDRPARTGDRPARAPRPERSDRPARAAAGARPERTPRPGGPARSPRPGGPRSGPRPGGPARGPKPGGPSRGPKPPGSGGLKPGGRPPRKPRP